LFYKAQILPWVSVKPDLQYITNPGGTGLDDALVGTVRAEIDF
jgi:carbohydrate-selective porin OprB